MYKLSFALSACAAMTEAASNFKNAMNLAQVSSDNCCCSVMPCMPDCDDECPAPRPPPPVLEPLPPPVQEVLLDLDVIVSHILNEIRPTLDPDTIPPANNPSEEFAFI